MGPNVDRAGREKAPGPITDPNITLGAVTVQLGYGVEYDDQQINDTLPAEGPVRHGMKMATARTSPVSRPATARKAAVAISVTTTSASRPKRT